MFTLKRVSSLLCFAVLAVGLLLAGSASAVPAAKPAAKPAKLSRLLKVAHVDPQEGYNGDVYGHLDYAYLSSYHGAACPSAGVRVYDIHNLAKPKRVSTFADVKSQPRVARTWTEKTIVKHVSTPSFKGELAVVSFQRCGGDGFQGFGLYDVTRPADPKPISLTHLEPRGSHEIWLNAKGRRAYVYTAIPRSEVQSSPDYDPQTQRAQTPGDPDFRIFDVTDPARPVQVGEWGAWKERGIKPWEGRGRLAANFVHSVITNPAATRAYLSYWDFGTVILDIRDPANPRYLGHTSNPQGDVHSAALARKGKVLVETHETADGHPTLYDISNPARPKTLSAFRLPGSVSAAGFSNGVHDPKVLGNRAYFSWYVRGVAVADISNPRKPRLVARFRPPTAPDPDDVLCDTASCRLVWGVYATKRYVLASDMLSGLWVLRLK